MTISVFRYYQLCLISSSLFHNCLEPLSVVTLALMTKYWACNHNKVRRLARSYEISKPQNWLTALKFDRRHVRISKWQGEKEGRPGGRRPKFFLCFTHWCWVCIYLPFWLRYWLVAYSVPNHYLNHFWFIITWTFENKFQWIIETTASRKIIWKYRPSAKWTFSFGRIILNLSV